LLLYAGRGTVFRGTFWRGWLESLFMFAGQGVSALPIAELPDAPLVLFMFMVLLYLAVIAYAVIRGWHLSVGKGTVLLATVAAYGMALLLVFVNRSHPFNLCHETAPFAVVLTALVLAGYQALQRRVPRSSLPYALIVGLVLLLVTKAGFQSYPSYLGSLFTDTPTGGLSLRSNPADISGLPQDYEPFVRDFQDICSAIHTLAPDGKGIAIIDLNDTLLYYGSDARPWSRYAS